VLWLAARKPVVLAVYHTQQVVHAQPNDAIIAAATRVVMRAFG
jgi:beta-lactamase class A